MDGTGSSGTVAALRPWPGILIYPRRAIRAAVDGRRWSVFVPIVALWAARGLLWYATEPDTEADPGETLTLIQQASVVTIVVAILVAAGLLLPFILGRLFGGRGRLSDVVMAIDWSSLPQLLVGLPVDVSGVALHGPEWWSLGATVLWPATFLDIPPTAAALRSIEKLAGFWALGLFVIGLSEVHGISKRRAFLAIVLPLFVMGALAAIAITVMVASVRVPL
jgi:hypothetical protein